MTDSRYRHHLPQLDGSLYLTDGGLETSLIFLDGIDLPQFASFDLLKDDEGTDALRRYFRKYAKLAADNGTGFVLESPTWRASARWGKEIGYTEEELERLNRKAIGLMEEIREEFETDAPFVISGNIGPQDDGYNPTQLLSADEAEEYHSTQINTFADTAADMVTVMTMTYADEAIGVARAAKAAGMPSVIAFTTETDGKLPDGQGLGEAIAAVEDATDATPPTT
jgi:S-methylmethionine-dependent homocysteine/selenocysteine methylase